MTSKYNQIAALLRARIQSGAYRESRKLPTEMELAEACGANRQTVRRALAVLVEEGLIERRQGSGSYIRNAAPPEGANVAILATYINDYIFPEILQDAQAVFGKSGYRTMVFCTHNCVNTEREILKGILEKPVGGLLVEGTKTALPNPNLDLYRELQESGVRIVFLHGAYAALPDAVCISDDDFRGGCLLTDFLLRKGHRKIAGIFKSDDIQGLDRYFGFLSSFRGAGLPLPDSRILWYSTEDREQLLLHGETARLQDFAERVLKDSTAVVCYNDEVAFSLINLLIPMGISVPEDLAVVSFDNSSYSELCQVKITSLAHGAQHIGRIAAERLIGRMQGQNVRSEALPWTLVEKESG